MIAIYHLIKGEFMNKRYSAKKRMMFIQREDYNFLAYNLLLVLHTLDCTSEQKRFKDFRKIAYLIDFISNGADFKFYSSTDLSQIYISAQLVKIKLLSHLLIVLKNRNFIDISINASHNTFDIWLNIDLLPIDFFNANVFSKEIENIKALKSQIHSLRSAEINSLVKEFYTNKGVMTWVI